MDGYIRFIMRHPKRRGFTGVLRGRYRFSNGVCHIRANALTAGTERVLRSLGAIREGMEVPDGWRTESDAPENGEDGTVPSLEGEGGKGRSAPGPADEGVADAGAEPGSEGEGAPGEAGPEGTPPEVNERLRDAVLDLDPEVNTDWTKDGRPAVEAVAKRYGSADVTRAMIEDVLPGYNREQAGAEDDDA